jgi:lysozyme
VGNQTIGYGHMVAAGESFPSTMTEAQADSLFERDVSRIVNNALNQVHRPLTQNQVDALGSFIFNVGPGNFQRSVLPALNAGDHDRATAQMAEYSKGRNQRTGERTTLRGLVRRRVEEIALFRTPPGTPPRRSSALVLNFVKQLFAVVTLSPRSEQTCALDV